MTFGRDKRLLLGWLALLAPIPLPFNTVLEWPVLFLYTLLVLYYLQRSEAEAVNWLPNWALNVLGGLYLPLFLLDIRLSVTRGSPVKALLHLIMFLVIAKLYSIRREKDKWHIMVAIFFVFVGAMATSSHVTISIYLLAFLVLSLYALARLAHWHVLASVGQSSAEDEKTQRRGKSLRRPMALVTLLIIAVSVPLFATMPRVREPFILGRGGTGIGRTTGFSDSVDLGVTSRIRGNRNVAMRLQYSEPVADAGSLRFKGATFEYYRNRRWFRELRPSLNLRRRSDGFQYLQRRSRETPSAGEVNSSRRAEIFLEPLGNNSLVVPVETKAVRLDNMPLMSDPGGALMTQAFGRRDTLRFEVELHPEPFLAGRLDPDGPLNALQIGDEVTPAIRDLAAQLMGDGSEEQQLDRLLQALVRDYSYSDDLSGRDGQNPLEEFLFVYKSGHCEYFASAMVLMLRSQGIPARYVTGFLGAELNPLESYYIVRQQNAHAWVEAHTPSRGWQVYDPTPPEGRPAISQQGLGLFFRQLADYIMFRWDRYVLTFGAEDQKSLFNRLREALSEWWSRFQEDDEVLVVPPQGIALDESANAEVMPLPGEAWSPRVYQGVLFLLAVLATGAWIWWRQRRSWTASRSYLWLRRALAKVTDEADATIAPLRVQELALARYPETDDEIRSLFRLYLRESFAGRPLDAEEQRQVLALQRRIEGAEQQARKRDRRAVSATATQNPL